MKSAPASNPSAEQCWTCPLCSPDTGFCGTLVIGEELFNPAHAEPAGIVEAELAAGQIFVYPSFVARSRWLGMDAEIEILVGPGKAFYQERSLFFEQFQLPTRN